MTDKPDDPLEKSFKYDSEQTCPSCGKSCVPLDGKRYHLTYKQAICSYCEHRFYKRLEGGGYLSIIFWNFVFLAFIANGFRDIVTTGDTVAIISIVLGSLGILLTVYYHFQYRKSMSEQEKAEKETDSN